MARQGQSLSATVVAILVCCSYSACVVAEVKLTAGTEVFNKEDPAKYKDCSGLHKAGYNISGAYKLFLSSNSSFLIHCEFTKYTAFSVIQRRVDNSVNFIQPLNTYINGFGNAQGNYWAGLDVISHLTMTGNRELTINMQDYRGKNYVAHYTHFLVQSRQLKYQMTVAGFSGFDLQDELSFNSGMPFHTYDVPDPNNCSTEMKAGWWYNHCSKTLLNGYYYMPGPYQPSSHYFDGIFWNSVGGSNYSLKFVSMSVSPKSSSALPFSR